MNDGWKKMIRGLSVGLALTALAACTQAVSDGTNDVDSRLKTTGCIRTTAYGIGCGDSPNADIPMNGLSTRALAANLLSAHAHNSATFVASPLTAEAFKKTGLAQTLVEPNTRQFLRYALRCAMVPTQSFAISGVDAATGAPWTINETGVEGLCPEWANSSADVACQERVSACLLAENNPLGVHVPLSMRGAIELGDEPLRTQVPTIQITKLESGLESDDRIASFAPCTGPASGFKANCGWSNPHAVGYIGLCTVGDTITIGTGGVNACGGVTLGESSSNTVLRACTGLRGCDEVDAIASDDDTCSNKQSFVSFKCPANAPVPGSATASGLGSFSVMIASSDRSVAVEAVSRGKNTTLSLVSAPKPHVLEYPAPEVDVFTRREGAFFGNIFDVHALTWTYALSPNHQLVPTQVLSTTPRQLPVQYRNMFACSDPTFGDPAAHLAGRICAAGAGGNCVANPLGPCTATAPSPTYCNHVGANGAYAACHTTGQNAAEFPALTTFLHTDDDFSPNTP